MTVLVFGAYEQASGPKHWVCYPERNHVCNNIIYKYRPLVATSWPSTWGEDQAQDLLRQLRPPTLVALVVMAILGRGLGVLVVVICLNRGSLGQDHLLRVLAEAPAKRRAYRFRRSRQDGPMDIGCNVLAQDSKPKGYSVGLQAARSTRRETGAKGGIRHAIGCGALQGLPRFTGRSVSWSNSSWVSRER